MNSKVVGSVVDKIKDQIRTGSLKPGDLLPSEQLLASTYGASRGSVRRAIEALIESGELARRPHSRPVISSSTFPKNLGREVFVWVSRPIADPQALVLIKQISAALRGTNYRLTVREPSRFTGEVVTSDERDFYLSVLNNPDVAGAIIEGNPFSGNDEIIKELVARGKHLVFVDTPPPDNLLVDYVGTANLLAARTCVEHLISLGHSRIVCAADSEGPGVIKARIRGFQRAMSLAGIEPLGKVLIGTELSAPTGDANLAGPYAGIIKRDEYFANASLRLVEEILAMDPMPSAIMACHDVLAFWLWAILEGKGVSVPQDISIVGFDCLAKWDTSVPDLLTTASQHFESFGQHAANLLLDRLSGDAPPSPRHVLLDAPLVIRSSTISDLMLPTLESARLDYAKMPR